MDFSDIVAFDFSVVRLNCNREPRIGTCRRLSECAPIPLLPTSSGCGKLAVNASAEGPSRPLSCVRWLLNLAVNVVALEEIRGPVSYVALPSDPSRLT